VMMTMGHETDPITKFYIVSVCFFGLMGRPMAMVILCVRLQVLALAMQL